MATAPGKKGSNKLKRVGSRKLRIEQYYLNRYPKNKLRRILNSNGVRGIDEARSWADKHLCQGLLAVILQKRT